MDEIIQAQEKFSLLDQVPLGICVLQSNQVVLFWNCCLEEWTKIPRKQILGTGINEHFPHFNQPQYAQRLQQIFQGGPPTIFSSQLHKYIIPAPLPQGRSRIQHTTVTAVPTPDGNGFLALLSIQDVTDLTFRVQEYRHMRDQALAEAQQRQKAQEAAEAANRVKDEFLAIVSHELRSPLNPILGWARLLKKQQLEPATIDRALETIERNAKVQAQLIDDLLDVSRILRGKLTINFEQVDLVSTIEAAIETVRLAAEAKSIDFSFSIFNAELEDANQIESVDNQLPHNLKSRHFALFPPTRASGSLIPNPKFLVRGDSNRLQQVVWNLLSNAVKFTPSGGRVEVQLSKIGIEQATPSYAQIKVIDTGIGINPDFLPYVFEYFRQADSSTTRSYGGLGLGLAIVRQLIELHGGTVWAESLGESMGATFTLQLPLLQEEGTRIKGKEIDSVLPYPSSLSLEGIKILVVDDEVDTREFLAFLLEEFGAIVTVTASANEAIAALASQPDILLSDLGMPDVDGYTLIRQLRTMPAAQGGQIPAIALTAYAAEATQKQVFAAGFQKYVTKPAEPIELVEAISSLVEKIPPRLEG